MVDQSELLLAVRGDIPAIKESLSDLKEALEGVREAVSTASNDHNMLVNQVSTLKDTLAEMKAENAKRFDAFDLQLTKIVTKEEPPWYKSFEKVIIFLLIITLGSLAGVKGYSDYIGKIMSVAAPAPSDVGVDIVGEGP